MTPAVLYHGTAAKHLKSIREHGIVPGRGGVVFCSADPRYAKTMGTRHGQNTLEHRSGIVLVVNVRAAEAAGVSFRLKDDGQFHSERIPPECIAAEPWPERAVAETPAEVLDVARQEVTFYTSQLVELVRGGATWRQTSRLRAELARAKGDVEIAARIIAAMGDVPHGPEWQ